MVSHPGTLGPTSPCQGRMVMLPRSLRPPRHIHQQLWEIIELETTFSSTISHTHVLPSTTHFINNTFTLELTF